MTTGHYHFPSNILDAPGTGQRAQDNIHELHFWQAKKFRIVQTGQAAGGFGMKNVGPKGADCHVLQSAKGNATV